MSHGTKLVYRDVADSELGAAIIDGAAKPGGYVAAAAVSGYSLANALHHDRYTVAKVTGTNCVLDVDLGAAGDVEAIALLNVYLDSGSSYPTIKAWSSPDNVTYYDHGEAFNATGWVGVKNRVFALPSCYARRYWRLQVTAGTAWYVGKVMLGKLHDFGDWYSPGSSHQSNPPKARFQTPTGLPITHVNGAVRWRFDNIHNVVSEAFKDVCIELDQSGKPFVYVGIDGTAHHVELAEAVRPEHLSAAESRWNLRLTMEALP